MRKILLLIPFFLFYNCGPEAEKFGRNYSIKNTTNQLVELDFYSLSTQQTDFTNIKLERNESLSGRRFEFSRPVSTDPDYTGPQNSFLSDSLVIIFGNQKKISTSLISDREGTFSEPKSRNVFRHGNYEATGNEMFLFKITQEDFENAIPCDGDCD